MVNCYHSPLKWELFCSRGSFQGHLRSVHSTIAACLHFKSLDVQLAALRLINQLVFSARSADEFDIVVQVRGVLLIEFNSIASLFAVKIWVFLLRPEWPQPLS